MKYKMHALGGNGNYLKISDDWTKVEVDSHFDDTCPLFHYRFICIQGKDEKDPYILVVNKNGTVQYDLSNKNDTVQYDLSNKTVTFAGTNVIEYSSLKSFSLPSLCE